MIIPTNESLRDVIQEILDKDYTDHPELPIKSNLEYPEPMQVDIPVDSVDKVLTSNYVEPTRALQSAYESQFRSFSNRKESDSFEVLL